MPKRRQLLSSDDAKVTKKQHKAPCSDCPFARTALPGWLGDELDADGWVLAAHGESRIECHTKLTQQCAGSAIYRANVIKVPRDPDTLVLPKDREKVFATPQEFKNHHTRKEPA